MILLTRNSPWAIFQAKSGSERKNGEKVKTANKIACIFPELFRSQKATEKVSEAAFSTTRDVARDRRAVIINGYYRGYFGAR